jgi:hypothetical protein
MSNDEFVKLDLDGMFDDERRFGRKKKADRIKVLPGTSVVLRILRGKTDTKFYSVRRQHWGIPQGSSGPPLACATAHDGSDCYFCDLVSEYYNSGDPRKKALASRMKASSSVMSNVIDVRDPVNDDGSPKVQLWQYTWAIFQDLMRYFKDSEYGDVTNPSTGRNFKVSAEKVSEGTSSFIKYKITPGANPSKLENMEALDHLIDLEEIFPPRFFTYDDQKSIAAGEFDPRKGKLPAPPSKPQLTEGSDTADEFFPEDDSPKPTKKVAEEEFEETSGDGDWEDEFEEGETEETSSDDPKRDDVKKKLEDLKKVVANNRQ